MARTNTWSDEHLVSEYGVDLALEELDGFRVGQKIEMTADDDDAPAYVGDTATIIGFSVVAAASPGDENYAIRQRFGTAHERRYAIVEIDQPFDEPITLDLAEAQFDVV